MANPNDDWEEDNGAVTPSPASRETSGDDWEIDAPASAKPTNEKKSFMGVSYNPEKNDFKNKGILSTVLNEFTKPPDDDAKATFETFGYPGGLVSDAGIEALKRLTGHEGLGKAEWSKALKGHATPATEQLNAEGYGPLVSYGVGLPYAAMTDPLSGFLGPADKEGASSPTAMQALTQTRPGVGMVEGANQPISSVMQKAAKAIYGAPFKKVDAELVSKFRNGGKSGGRPFTSQLWNEGNPLVGGFSKSNPEIGEQITNLRKGVGQDIGNRIREAGGSEEVHLAPNLQENAKSEMMQAMPEPKLSKEQEQALTLLPPDQANAARSKIIEKAKADLASESDPSDWIKNQLASKDKNARAKAIKILSDSAPELSKVIQTNAKHLAQSGSKADILNFYNGLIDDLNEGPRSLEGLQDLKISMQNAAARNQQMGANQYARNALPNAAKTAEMHAAEQLGQVIDGIVDKHLGNKATSTTDKTKYSALRRGEVPAWRVIQSQQSRPALSKLDLLLGLSGAAEASQHPAMIGTAIGTKALDELRRSPRFATGTGRTLNRAAQSNLWDNMLRRGMLNSANQQGGNK